jgi:hypothetical protein
MVSPFFNLGQINGTNGFTVTGVNAGDQLGWTVAGAGDINNDGINDILIGAPSANNGVGEAYVLFGQKTFPAVISVSSLNGKNGFVISSPPSQLEYLAISVSGIGDINNDGYDDVIVGAIPTKAFTGNLQTFVIFGASSFPQTVSISGLNGSNGFTIIGDPYQQGCIESVRVISTAAAGDINADGIADIALGFSQFDQGDAYVIFGGNNFPAVFNVSNLIGNNGFQISYSSRVIGVSVNGISDINGDGFNDLIIGDASTYCGTSQYVPAQAYVVYGSKNGFPAKCCNFNGVDGFIINSNDISLTISVSGLGDVNDDGLADIGMIGCAVNSFGQYCLGASGSNLVGIINLVLGNQTFPANFTFNQFDNPGKNSILDGFYEYLSSANMMNGIGDVNLDGIDDFIVGSPYSYLNNYGFGYVIFGNKAGYSPQFNVGRLDGVNGFTLNGTTPNDYTGFAVAGLGDVNGDGISDFAISAPNAIIDGESDVGCVYVVFGAESFVSAFENPLVGSSMLTQDNLV